MDDPPDPATAPDQPDDSSRAGAEPGAQVNLEPRLAFYSDMDRDSEIVVWNIGGTGERLLTDNFDEELHPAWSPDGTRVAFVSDRAGSYDIFVVDADGSDPVQITDDDFRESRPAWSPDGSWEDSDIWVMDADGTDRRLLLERATRPEWSPDGGRITFMSDRDGDWEIFVMDSDGGNVTQLTFNNDYDIAPTWSPATGR